MPATPQDHQRPKAETANQPFEFTHDGESFTLPPADAIKAGMIRRFRKQGDLDMAFSILEEIADGEAIEALDKMTLHEFNEVLEAWQVYIGVTPGKS